MKTIYFFIVLLFYSITSFSQQTTYTKTFDWAQDIITMNMHTYDDGLYIPLLVYNDGELGRSIIYHFDHSGEIMDSIELVDGLYNWIFEIIPDENNNFYAFGSSWETHIGPVKDNIYYLNSNLELLDNSTNPTDWGGYNRMHGFTNSNGNFVIIGDLSSNAEAPHIWTYNVRITEYDQNMNTIIDTIYDRPESGQIVWAADQSHQNTYHLYTNYDFDPNYFNQPQYNYLDSNYHIIYSSDIVTPVNFKSYSSIKMINNEEFYQAGDVNVFEQPNIYYTAYAVYKFNLEYEIQDSVIINFNNDTTSRIAFYNGFDYYNPNELYFLGTKNYSIDENAYLELIKLDSNLNISWRKFYGGDQNYMANEVAALEDGGCIITSVSRAENGNRKAIIMKIDEEGLVTSSNEEESIPIKNAIITPNPGKNYLQLHTGIYPATLLMYHINGQLILEEAIHESSKLLNTQNLASGTYVWQLVKDGEVVESGKWVKE